MPATHIHADLIMFTTKGNDFTVLMREHVLLFLRLLYVSVRMLVGIGPASNSVTRNSRADCQPEDDNC